MINLILIYFTMVTQVTNNPSIQQVQQTYHEVLPDDSVEGIKKNEEFNIFISKLFGVLIILSFSGVGFIYLYKYLVNKNSEIK
jgi:hypothetical protein